MAGSISFQIRYYWRRLNNLDRAAVLLGALYGVVWLVRLTGRPLSLFLFGLIQFLLVLAISLVVVARLFSWIRRRHLWSLRNRLVVAYLFIAVVPVILLGAMAWLSAILVYQQLGAYLLYDAIQDRIERLTTTADDVMASLPATVPKASPAGSGGVESAPSVAAVLSAARRELPGLAWAPVKGAEALLHHPRARNGRFEGIVHSGEQVLLMSVASRPSGAQPRVVSLSVPLSSELVDRLLPDLGPIQFDVSRPARPTDPQHTVTVLGVSLKKIATRRRDIPPPAIWFDRTVSGVATLEVIPLGDSGAGSIETYTLFASLASRPSLLNRRLFDAPGTVGGVLTGGLLLAGIVFLLIELAALITGVNLTRTITRAVSDLYHATQHVQSGDFSHRVHLQRHDQLGELGESFNAMTSSIAGLIEEQRQRQRLENEISIAREVQSQLFPKSLPEVPGVDLAALCRAARMVSGDYYDFIQLGPTRLGMVIADISGKGISAALLMASLQGALRSQLLVDGTVSSEPAALVSRLNRHLFLNTSDDRYATLFYAVYDSAQRMLHYTNAGHLPPILVSGDEVKKLEEGGMVVGLFDECGYEQGSLRVAPGSILVAYSDGITEPENVYGEQFGFRRLKDEVLRHRSAPAQRMADLLVAAAEEWGQSPEQADDMTVVVARLE